MDGIGISITSGGDGRTGRRSTRRRQRHLRRIHPISGWHLPSVNGRDRGRKHHRTCRRRLGASPFPVAGVDVSNGAKNNFIGADGYGNTLMFSEYGVLVDGATTTGNMISQNSIDNNGIKGIGLETGSNNNEPAPALPPPPTTGAPLAPSQRSSVPPPALPGAAFTFELFNSPACNDTGFGEGSDIRRRRHVRPVGAGTIDLSFGPAAAGTVVTATLTDANNNTSQFSNCVTVSGESTPTPTPSPSSTAIPSPTSRQCHAHPGLADWRARARGHQQPARADGATTATGSSTRRMYVAALRPLVRDGSTAPGCPDLGQAEPAALTPHPWGDTDCDTLVDALDALYVMEYEAGFDIEQLRGLPPLSATCSSASTWGLSRLSHRAPPIIACPEPAPVYSRRTSSTAEVVRLCPR